MITSTFLGERTGFAVFRDAGSWLVSGGYQFIHVSTVMKPCRNFFEFLLNNVKHSCEVVSWLRLLSEMSKHCTCRGDSFLMLNISSETTYRTALVQYMQLQVLVITLILCRILWNVTHWDVRSHLINNLKD